MNYWILWPVLIVSWCLLGWIEFAYLESKALQANHQPSQITLSMFCYTITKRFPLSIFWLGIIVGLFFGSLSVHLWWHWCPPGSISSG